MITEKEFFKVGRLVESWACGFGRISYVDWNWFEIFYRSTGKISTFRFDQVKEYGLKFFNDDETDYLDPDMILK